MQIQLNQQEIEEAVTDFVAKQGFDLTSKEVTVAFTAGRGSNGITADIDIQNIQTNIKQTLPRKGILRDVDQTNPILHSNSGFATPDREPTQKGSNSKQASDTEQSLQDAEATVSEQKLVDEEVVNPKSTTSTSLFT